MAKAEELMSIDQIKEKYKSRWVAVKVVERDEAGQPVKGIVVTSDHSRIRIRDQITRGEEVCIFYTGEIPQPGYLAVF